MSTQLPPGAYHISYADYDSYNVVHHKINIGKCLSKNRRLTQAELEMEELLLGEMHQTVYYDNVWEVNIPYAPRKIVCMTTSANFISFTKKIVREISHIPADQDEKIIVVTEFESMSHLAKTVGGHLIKSMKDVMYGRPQWSKSHLMMYDAQVRVIPFEYKEKAKKDRTNNGAKWKKQTKPYHQR